MEIKYFYLWFYAEPAGDLTAKATSHPIVLSLVLGIRYVSIVFMPNIIQVRIPRVITVISLGGILLFFSAILFAANLSAGNPIDNFFDKNNYDKDVQILYQTAQKLGYTKEHELNFFRSQGTFESNHDFTKLIFSTTDSIDTFSRKIDNLGLLPDNSVPNIYGMEILEDAFVTDINEPYSRRLVIVNSTSEYSEMPMPRKIAPLVTRWQLLDSKEPNKYSKRHLRLVIFFAQLPKEGVFWKDKLHGKTLSGPIVVMSLSR